MNFYKNSKLAIIGTVGVPGCYGGFETLAEQLVRKLGHEIEITVYCSTHAYAPAKRTRRWNNANLVWLPFKANGAQGILYDIFSILHALWFADTLLVLGVPGAFIFPFVKFFTRKRIVVNIDGLEWSRQKWGWLACNFLRWCEAQAVRWADEVITDNAAIQKYALERYGRRTELITYGGDQARSLPLSPEIVENFPFVTHRYAFTVCRIEPENNIHVLLEAFSKSEKMPLAVVGNWKSSEYGQNLCKKYGNHPNIHLLDPIYDLDVLNRLRSNTALYLHGHSAGGTNPSLAEAMHLGVPIFAFDVIFNRVTTHHQAFYFSTEKELRTLLEFADLNLFEDSARTMQTLAEMHYTWRRIASQYASLVDAKVPEPVPIFDFDIPVSLRQRLQLA